MIKSLYSKNTFGRMQGRIFQDGAADGRHLLMKYYCQMVRFLLKSGHKDGVVIAIDTLTTRTNIQKKSNL